tara:strand:- start:2179 stop:3453 length:1275 start_codon:yes stop_codon:yes gene_type:complete
MARGFNFKQWLMVGFILRLSVMPFTFHGDIFFILLTPMYLIDGELDAYGTFAARYGLANNTGYYPPFTLLYFSFWEFILSCVFVDFPNFSEYLFENNAKGFLDSNTQFRWIFLLKVHYLAFDALLVNTIFRMLPSGDHHRKTFTIFWALNPVIVFGTYMVGQLDLIPSSLVVLSCYFCLRKGKEHFAALSLAAGCLFKVFPIIFLPMVICLTCRTLKSALKISLYGILPVVVIYGIFYGISGSPIFSLFSGQQHNIEISMRPEAIILRGSQALIYAIVCFHIWKTPLSKLNYLILVQYFLIVYFAIYLGFFVSSVHRYIWFTPFILFWIHHNHQWRKPFYFFLMLIFLGCLRSRSTSLGILAPINPKLFMSFPSVKDAACFLMDCALYYKIITYVFKAACVIGVGVLTRGLYISSFTIGNKTNK